MTVGLLNGAALAVATGIVIFLLWHDLRLCFVFGLALVINLFMAAMAGAVVPLVLDRVGRDPAVSSSIFVTFVTDFTGFFAFLGLAALILL
jgi:magnesium transporter